MKNLTLVFIFFLMVAHTSGQTANKWSLAVHYGPQISSFKKDGTSISPTHKIFGTQKAVIGKAYGADIELRKNKWIFGIGYTYCENKKRYEAQEGGAAIFDPAYAVRFTLRNIEQGFLLYADRKLNTRKRSEIFAGLGLLATRGDDQVIDNMNG
ncbi:MAG: hypothetical protein EOO13_13055 [Chitinophagaceae bacterium]|nr:MAG: hypothetical protein EOO13_13055 [Chitinophagaceae bacterium]